MCRKQLLDLLEMLDLPFDFVLIATKAQKRVDYITSNNFSEILPHIALVNQVFLCTFAAELH